MGLIREIKKSIRDRKNEKTIARIKKNLSVLSALDDAGDCFPYEKQVMSDILILPKDKEKNNELLQPLHLYFMTLYPKGRLSLDESADNKSIEMFTDEFIAHPKLIKNRFYYIDLQKVILMLILANLSIHNVKHAEKLLDQYYVIFRERYKARMYVQILSCNCGKMSLKRIEDLFASCADAYEKECTILNYKADFVYHLYLLSSRTGVESPEFSGLLEDVCRRFSGMPSPVIIQLFREFCYNNEHIDLVRAYLDSLGESEYTKKYASEIDVLRVLCEGREQNAEKITRKRTGKGPAEAAIGYKISRIRQNMADKDYDLGVLLTDIDNAVSHYRSVAEHATSLEDRLIANKDIYSLLLMRPEVNYWKAYRDNFKKVIPSETERVDDSVFIFINEHSLVNGAVTLPFLLEARRRGIPCYAFSPKIHLDSCSPEDDFYELYGWWNDGIDVGHYQDHDISGTEIDIPGRRIICRGMNIYQPVFEIISRYQFTYGFHYETDAWVRYKTNSLIKLFNTFFRYAENVEKWAISRGKKVYFISNAPHIHYAAAFRIYCEEKGFRNGLNYICTSPGYDNYFLNATDPRSETATALNLTRNLKSRNSFLGTSEGFERYYENNRWRLPEIREKMQKHLEAQRSRDRMRDSNEAKEETLRQIRQAKSEGRKILLLNGKVIVDLAVKYTKGCVHSDMREWITHAVDFANRNSDKVLLLIKPHPHEGRKDLIFTSEKIDDLSSLIDVDMGENVIYLDKDMFTNSELAPYMDLGLVWNGTSSLEFAAQGKKVLLADVWGHYDYPIGFVFPKTIEEYERYMLDPSLMKEREDIGDRAITFLEYMGSDDVRIQNLYSKTTLMNIHQFESSINAEAIDEFVRKGNEHLKEKFNELI